MKFQIILVFFALILLTMLLPQNAHAQTCPDLVQDAYDTTQAVCADIGSDEACYGNIAIDAEPDTLEFTQSGDLVGVDQIEGLRLSSMNVDAQEWGLSLMHVAVLSSNEEPQTVELVLFGNVEIENTAANDDAYAPMQAFLFRSGVEDRPCEAAPDSGLLIQTPQGVGEIAMLVNEVRIDLGSTAYLQAAPGGEMIVYLLDGQAEITAQGVSIIVPAGALGRIPLDANGLATGPPQGPEPYNASTLQSLPVPLLTDQVAIAPPLSSSGSAPDSGDGESGDLTSGFYMVDLACEGDITIETEAPAQVNFSDDLSSLSLNFALLTAFYDDESLTLERIEHEGEIYYEFYEEAEYDLLGDGEHTGIEYTIITIYFLPYRNVDFVYDYFTDDETYETYCDGGGVFVGTELSAPTGSGLVPIPGLWNTSSTCDEEAEPYETLITDIGEGRVSMFFDEVETLFTPTDTGLYLATVSGGEDMSAMGIYIDFLVVEDNGMEAVLFAFGSECVYTFTP